MRKVSKWKYLQKRPHLQSETDRVGEKESRERRGDTWKEWCYNIMLVLLSKHNIKSSLGTLDQNKISPWKCICLVNGKPRSCLGETRIVLGYEGIDSIKSLKKHHHSLVEMSYTRTFLLRSFKYHFFDNEIVTKMITYINVVKKPWTMNNQSETNGIILRSYFLRDRAISVGYWWSHLHHAFLT